MRYGYDMRKGLRFRGEPQNEGLFYFCYCSGQTKTNKPLTMYMAGVEFVWLASGGGGESRTPVRKRFPRNFSGRRRLFWESCSPSSLSCRQAVTPTGQVSFIIHGRFKALPAHVHHETTPVPGPWSSRVRRPLFKQRRERYRYRSLIYKLPVFRWSGATARYSCFRVPVETGTPPRRHKVCSAPFPPGGESFAGSLAPPHRTGPACAGLRFGWRLRRRARSSYFNPAGHSAPQA